MNVTQIFCRYAHISNLLHLCRSTSIQLIAIWYLFHPIKHILFVSRVAEIFSSFPLEFSQHRHNDIQLLYYCPSASDSLFLIGCYTGKISDLWRIQIQDDCEHTGNVTSILFSSSWSGMPGSLQIWTLHGCFVQQR